jgi:hypothetical protein
MTTGHEDDTRRILDLLARGKTTVDEAERLLQALGAAQARAQVGRDDPATESAAPEGRRPKPSWFRINIRKPANEHREAKDVNIRVPVSVMKGGMRLGAIIATFAGEKAARRMRERGIDLDLSKVNGDLSNLNGPDFEQFLASLHDMNFEIEDGKSQVRITCE